MQVTGDHPKTAEAIARKINLILGDTKQSLAAKTGRPVEEIYEDEVSAVVVHGDDIDNLQVNVFTPLTKKTICEILRFERLLLENSTNRKTFNSYDVSRFPI